MKVLRSYGPRLSANPFCRTLAEGVFQASRFCKRLGWGLGLWFSALIMLLNELVWAFCEFSTGVCKFRAEAWIATIGFQGIFCHNYLALQSLEKFNVRSFFLDAGFGV